MIERVDMYRVLCDGCGREVDDEYYAWAEEDQAWEQAENWTWLVNDDGQWCPECTTWDEEADEQVPKGG